ncbi:hypothetical protein EVAR_56133_1 [Eumeta japonica]|uniref:RNA-directed DNA polymerase from mobile element jockey n=1 Tax=Eumeta variegata TaxID=151549 RepID=A0A4C1ZST6_EUMVA|nr:hypothetical protein EVAR_56133_1 [Eumeta japonica]
MEALTKKLHLNFVTLLTPTHYHNSDTYRPDILDITLMKGVALKLNCIETLQCLNSDHRPLLVRCPYQPHQLKNCSRVVPVKSDCKELPRDVSELIRSKMLHCVERANL